MPTSGGSCDSPPATGLGTCAGGYAFCADYGHRCIATDGSEVCEPCPAPTPTPAPTTAAPTPSPTPQTLSVALEHSLCFDQCELADQVGAMDATLADGAACAAGAGVALDGVDDHVTLGAAALGGAITLAVWVRLDAPDNNARVLDFGDADASNNIMLRVDVDAGAYRLRFRSLDGLSLIHIPSPRD